jgi:hypothetical protein
MPTANVLSCCDASCHRLSVSVDPVGVTGVDCCGKRCSPFLVNAPRRFYEMSKSSVWQANFREYLF